MSKGNDYTKVSPSGSKGKANDYKGIKGKVSKKAQQYGVQGPDGGAKAQNDGLFEGKFNNL